MEKETLTSQLETIGEQILMVSRNELYLKMRFMDVALSGYAFVTVSYTHLRAHRH